LGRLKSVPLLPLRVTRAKSKSARRYFSRPLLRQASMGPEPKDLCRSRIATCVGARVPRQDCSILRAGKEVIP
jgi:hypothetical protein